MVLAAPSKCRGYVYSFYIRRTDGILEGPTSSFKIGDERLQKAFNLNSTNKAMIHLADQVPTKFAGTIRVLNLVIYEYNRFWSKPTMSLLQTMGIGGCSTFLSNSKGQPKSINLEPEITSKY